MRSLSVSSHKYDLLFFLCCCSFNFNYALWPWWLGEPFPFQIAAFVLALDLDLALFGPSLRWYWCCYFFSGFGISFAFDYVFGIIQVLSLVPPFSLTPSRCPLLVAVPRAGLGFILKCLIVGACICVSSLSALLCRATLPQGHTDRVPPSPFLPISPFFPFPYTIKFGYDFASNCSVCGISMKVFKVTFPARIVLF